MTASSSASSDAATPTAPTTTRPVPSTSTPATPPLFHKGDQLYTTGPLGPGVTPVIVEGPLDAIAITLATGGTYVGVAPLGTSLTDDQAAQLRQHGHRTPIVATDADLAGRVAAERDYWILTPHGHDPRHAELPDGTDPADLLATGRGDVLAAALANSRPLAEQLVDERFAHLPASEAAVDALRVIAASPPDRWETGTQDVAERLGLPASLLRTALHDLVDAWNQDPRGSAAIALRDVTHVKTRLAHAEAVGVHERVTSRPGRTAAHPGDSPVPARAPSRGVDR